jgi:hypothetical protein
MKNNVASISFAALAGTAALCSVVMMDIAAAEALPKSGTVSVHSGYWAVGEAVNVAEKYVQGHGNNRGITFNDKGSGPLHLGPTDCFYTFYTAVERTKVKGYCTFGDTDGDRIFTDFSGAFDADGYVQGMHDVDAGTGKYAGIQGTMIFKCKYSGAHGELECTQRMTYKLP